MKLHELGYTTYAARRVQRMEHLTKAGIRTLAMDVTDDESLQSGVKHILAGQGRMAGMVPISLGSSLTGARRDPA